MYIYIAITNKPMLWYINTTFVTYFIVWRIIITSINTYYTDIAIRGYVCIEDFCVFFLKCTEMD